MIIIKRLQYRFFILLFFVGTSFTSLTQSKKEQIDGLNQTIDSIQKANFIKSEILGDSISFLNESLQISNQWIGVLEKDVFELEQIQKVTQKSIDSIKSIMANNKCLSLNTTTFYAGNYYYDSQIKEGPNGSLNIYADGKGNNYFSIDYVKGEPSYNMGTLSGVIRIYNNIGVFTATLQTNEESDSGSSDINKDVCIIEFNFDENGVNITQRSFDIECWFGGNVNVGGYYYKTDSENKVQDFKDFFQSTDDWEIQGK